MPDTNIQYAWFFRIAVIFSFIKPVLEFLVIYLVVLLYEITGSDQGELFFISTAIFVVLAIYISLFYLVQRGLFRNPNLMYRVFSGVLLIIAAIVFVYSTVFYIPFIQ